jgi:hypothetical protein
VSFSKGRTPGEKSAGEGQEQLLCFLLLAFLCDEASYCATAEPKVDRWSVCAVSSNREQMKVKIELVVLVMETRRRQLILLCVIVASRERIDFRY